MKLLDNFINKVGIDKCLHFSVGGMIAALIGAILILQGGITNWTTYGSAIVGTLSVAVLATLKEFCFDDKIDTKDILASVLGTIPMYLAVSIGLLFHYLSS